MNKIAYTSKGLKVVSPSMEEALLQTECFVATGVYERELSWHYLLTRASQELQEQKFAQNLAMWGLPLTENVAETQQVFHAKKAKHAWETLPMQGIEHTAQYQRAVELIQKKYGAGFADGRALFDYQLDSAAKMIAKKRILLALEMGLGKTLTTLVALTADPSNKKILIVTMSRNINDWVREVKALGLEENYIILEHPHDLRSPKLIHIVSYEKWSREQVTYRKKLHEKCPTCGSAHHRLWNPQLNYCHLCHAKAAPSEERYSDNDKPEKCPSCRKDYKGKHQCSCGFNLVESKKPALYRYFHNGYDAAAVDEAHYIKNGSSKRSLAVRAIRTKTRIALSGSPAENGTEDLFFPLAWVTGCTSRFEDPHTLDRFKPFGQVNLEHFREFYGGGSKRAVLDIDSVQARVSNHEKLWAVLDTLMIRKRKQDADVQAVIEVPKPQHVRMHVELNAAEREFYDDLVHQFKKWYEEELWKKEAAEGRGETYRISTIEICQWLDKLRKAASCPWSFEDFDAKKSKGTTAKLDYVKAKARDYIRRGQKILIFSSHKNTVEQLATLLDGIVPGAQAAYVHGDVKKEYRWELMNRFQNPNDPLSILIMSVRTGAESYTLTEAKCVILFDMDFNGKKLEQCYSRAVRLGQKDVVDVHWLIGVNTIDANIHGLVLSKISGVDLAIDRQELNFNEIAKEFKGAGASSSPSFDYEKFAAEMLQKGTSREEIVS